MIPIPDLLNRAPFLGIDQKALSDLLGLAILGREIGTEFHDLDILRQSRLVIDLMHDRFEIARSGLRRLYEGAAAIRETEEYATLAALLDDERRSTYQFKGGVARTSLAALTAERLGVTFENLSAAVDDRRAAAR